MTKDRDKDEFEHLASMHLSRNLDTEEVCCITSELQKGQYFEMLKKTLKRVYSECSYLLPGGYALRPLEITFEVTYRCNPKCKMCPLHGPNARSPFATAKEELSLPDVTHLIDQISKMLGLLPIKPSIFISGGEPFVRDDILQIMEYIRDRHITYSINTNGCLINKQKVERIIFSHPDSIIFSLDGPEKVHDEIRGLKGTFAKAVNAMKMIRAQASANELRMTINCVISSLNIDYLEEMVYLADDLEADLHYQHVMFLDNEII